MEKGTGKRFNEGKLRYDLLHPTALKGLAQVMTMGAAKYGDTNWQNGMPWKTVVASLKRHLALFEAGQDYDKESGFLHVDHIQANAHFLSAYREIYPEGDNRIIATLTNRRIGLDLDDVLIDFVAQYMKYFDVKERPKNWKFDYKMSERLHSVINDRDFWLNMQPTISPDDLHFEPAVYITNRSAPDGINEEWIEKFGFPTAPIVRVEGSKLETAKKHNVEIFVDDKYEHFVELNNNGVFCFLMDASHNRRYNVGFKRLMSLSEIK